MSGSVTTPRGSGHVPLHSVRLRPGNAGPCAMHVPVLSHQAQPAEAQEPQSRCALQLGTVGQPSVTLPTVPANWQPRSHVSHVRLNADWCTQRLRSAHQEQPDRVHCAQSEMSGQVTLHWLTRGLVTMQCDVAEKHVLVHDCSLNP